MRRRYDWPALPSQMNTQQAYAGAQFFCADSGRTGTDYLEGTTHVINYSPWANWRGSIFSPSFGRDASLRWGDDL